MSAGVDHLRLSPRCRAPEHEDQALAAGDQGVDDRVGEALPPLAAMGVGATRPDAEHRVEQEHPLPRPADELAVSRLGDPDGAVDFDEDVCGTDDGSVEDLFDDLSVDVVDDFDADSSMNESAPLDGELSAVGLRIDIIFIFRTGTGEVFLSDVPEIGDVSSSSFSIVSVSEVMINRL